VSRSVRIAKGIDMSMELSVCGVNCIECDYFKKSECLGCSEIKGQVWWASYVSATVCPIYTCVEDKKIDDCGMCSEMPCKLWRELKDPSHTDEQHEAGINERVENLRLKRER
jgi:hypothetical protein